MHTKKIITIAVVIIALAGGIYWLALESQPKVPSPDQPLEMLAACLKDKRAVFYGTFWCTHCQATKALFGSGAKFLPYVECSTVNGKGQLTVCKDKGITGYPTWVFADGSRESGELSLERLAEKTGCQWQ
jgi:hypothetical protein